MQEGVHQPHIYRFQNLISLHGDDKFALQAAPGSTFFLFGLPDQFTNSNGKFFGVGLFIAKEPYKFS